MGNTTCNDCNTWMEVDEFQSPYGEMGNTTRDNSFSRIMLDAGFSPLTGKWVIRHEQPNYHNPNYPCGFSPLTGKWVIRQKNNPFYGYRANVSFSPLTGKWVIRPLFFGLLFVLRVRGEFQSPYGEMGNTTQSAAWWKSVRAISFSPLTGKWVIRLCPSVPALGAGPQAIFSNLGLFLPFSGTRVQNQNRTVSFFPLVTPFLALFEIFKPTGFLTPK